MVPSCLLLVEPDGASISVSCLKKPVEIIFPRRPGEI